MKSTFAQLVSFVNRIDRRQLQLAYFVMMLVGAVVLRSPSDGGTGPI